MSGADLSPRSEVLRIALGTGGQDRGQTAYSHGLKAGSKLGLVSSLHNSLLGGNTGTINFLAPDYCPVLDGASRYRTMVTSKRAFKYNKTLRIV